MATRKKTSDSATYSRPELREKLKAEVIAGDKGGRPGQWSARKAQLLAREYEAAGGGYRKPPARTQQNLKKWSDEKWTTADGEKAVRKGVTARYLPEKAWDQLTPAQKRSTEKKKREGSRAGKQFVANTASAAKARKAAAKKSAPRAKP